MESKICTNCKVNKPLEEFHKASNGILGRRSMCSNCCNNRAQSPKARAVYNKARAARRANPEYRREESIKNNILNHKDPLRYLLVAAKARSKKKGLDFAITKDHIHLVDYCPLLGIKLQMNWGQKEDNSYSIDRIDNTKGYIPGNVWIISEKANRIKNTASFEELILIADNIKKYEVPK